MADFYPGWQPLVPPSLRTSEGEEIGLGPYSAQQCAHMECANCGQPITVGQRVTMLREWILGIGMSTGRLVFVEPHDWNEDAFVHSDCSAEFAHDQITKEPCGKDDDENVCVFCDSKLDGASE